MNENQIFLAYIALGAGIVIALTLIVLVVVLWKRLNDEREFSLGGYKELSNDFMENVKEIKQLREDYSIKIAGQSALMEVVKKDLIRLDKFEKQQTDENAAIYNAFRANHNETLTHIKNINSDISDFQFIISDFSSEKNRLKKVYGDITTIKEEISLLFSESELLKKIKVHKVERVKKTGKMSGHIGVKQAPKKTTKKK